MGVQRSPGARGRLSTGLDLREVRSYGGAPREADRRVYRAGTPLEEADRAGTGASAEYGAQSSIGAIAGPITGPMGTLGRALPKDRARDADDAGRGDELSSGAVGTRARQPS